jgi:tRNA nucleotidyltransferase (CCA-adding enzyme)
MNESLPPTLLRILRETPEFQGAFLVGGCVRDWLLQMPVKDFDVEIFGLGYERLNGVLSRWGRTDVVGRSFGVVKLTVAPGETYDFSLPRRDSKVAPGHRGFQVQCDPDLSPEEASARRDFTINALMWDPRRNVLLDFNRGQEDLRNRVLRHTSDAFPEDPLRVLRGMQFASRFRLTAVPETIELCRSIADTYRELPVERVREEWLKWAAKSVLPSAGLNFLRQVGWLAHFSEVSALVGVPQDPEWHPEGDVWTHTLHCCDALAELPEWRALEEETRIAVMFAVLAHDFAKPQCTFATEKHGQMRIVSPGHEPAGAPIAEVFLHRIGASHSLLARVPPLVANHLAHLQEQTPRSVRRLANRLAPATIEELAFVLIADSSGRPPLKKGWPDGLEPMLTLAKELQLQAEAPKPILLGRHLLERGLEAGPVFKAILTAAFEAQLDGVFTDIDGANRWLDAYLAD